MKDGAQMGPFVLTDATKDWTLLSKWNQSWTEDFPKLFPNAVTDFYPYNMLSAERQSPYLTRLNKGVKELMEDEETYHFGEPDDGSSAVEGPYMHIQQTLTLTLNLTLALITRSLHAPSIDPETLEAIRRLRHDAKGSGSSKVP